MNAYSPRQEVSVQQQCGAVSPSGSNAPSGNSNTEASRGNGGKGGSEAVDTCACRRSIDQPSRFRDLHHHQRHTSTAHADMSSPKLLCPRVHGMYAAAPWCCGCCWGWFAVFVEMQQHTDLYSSRPLQLSLAFLCQCRSARTLLNAVPETDQPTNRPTSSQPAYMHIADDARCTAGHRHGHRQGQPEGIRGLYLNIGAYLCVNCHASPVGRSHVSVR